MDLRTLGRGLALALLILVGAWALWRVGIYLGPFGKHRFVTELYVFVVAGVAALGWSRSSLKHHGARAGIAGLLVLVAGAMLLIQANGRIQQFGRDTQVAEWGVFHYYLGGKYFDELHYTDLYRQAAVADWDGGEGPNRFREVERVRDLHTYDFVQRTEARTDPPLDTFSDARWEEFKGDIEWFGRQAAPKRWRKILADRGYNPPPSYVLVSGTFCNLLSIRQPTSQTLLVLLDMLWLIVALLVSIRAYGLTRSLLVLCVFLLWYGNVNRVFGQIWILDWFAASWLALSSWKLGRPGWAGGLIAYAACMRVFPGVLALGPVVAAAPLMLRQRKIPERIKRFVVAGVVVATLLLGGSWARYGTEAWQDWAANISEHNVEHESGSRRFGLKQIFTLDWKGDLRSKKKIRTKRLEKNHDLYSAVRLLFVVFAVACMLRSDEHDAMLFGAAIFFAGIIASRYYGALLVLLLLLGSGGAPRGASEDAGGRPFGRLAFDLGMLALIWAVYAAPFGGKPREQYVFSNTMWVAWWLALFGVTLFARRPMRTLEGDRSDEPAG